MKNSKSATNPSFCLEDYHFDLPPGRIAQSPAKFRDASKLLVAHGHDRVVHTDFGTVGSFLEAGDVLVLNQTRVINARCSAHKTNGTQIEVFFLDTHMPDLGPNTLLPVLLKPARRVREGMTLLFRNSGTRVKVVAKGDQGKGHVSGLTWEFLQRVMEMDGETPLPPYIKRPQGPTEEDLGRYQTVYATEPGAIAAPTAGLHFTRDLLAQLGQKGVEIVRVTHHVGIGTFRPLIEADIREHVMDRERYILSDEAARKLTDAKNSGRRVVAVGTTSTRCLESSFDGSIFRHGTYETDLFIYPGYRFRVVDALITNFHLPGSSLILLVSALMGRDRIMEIYRQAIDRDYRFYSYGDAMLLIP